MKSIFIIIWVLSCDKNNCIWNNHIQKHTVSFSKAIVSFNVWTKYGAICTPGTSITTGSDGSPASEGPASFNATTRNRYLKIIIVFMIFWGALRITIYMWDSCISNTNYHNLHNSIKYIAEWTFRLISLDKRYFYPFSRFNIQHFNTITYLMKYCLALFRPKIE